jgi:hypothetical protein
MQMPYKKELQHGHNKKGSPSRTYKSWQAMKGRCYREKNNKFHSYGAKGVTVCDEWMDFRNFLRDMGERPDGASIDRIDNSKGYFKENCRWAIPELQSRNRGIHKNNNSGISGVHKDHRRGTWVAQLGCEKLGTSHDFFEACCLRKSAEALKWNLHT